MCTGCYNTALPSVRFSNSAPFFYSDEKSEGESEFMDNIPATKLAQIIKPNHHEEIPKTPLSAYHTTSAIWSSEGDH